MKNNNCKTQRLNNAPYHAAHLLQQEFPDSELSVTRRTRRRQHSQAMLPALHIIIIIIIKNECHSNMTVERLQGCSHSKKLREGESESRSSKVV